MNSKVIYSKDDLKEWYSSEILSYKHQISLDIPLVYREFLLRVLMRLIPDGYSFQINKIENKGDYDHGNAD